MEENHALRSFDLFGKCWGKEVVTHAGTWI